MKERRTIRKFKDEEIPDSNLYEFIDCARLAPSGANMQPLKYVVVKSREMLDKVFECTAWAGYLKGKGTPGEVKDRRLILQYSRYRYQKSGFELDAGAAAMSIILAAQEMGIASCWLGALNREKLYDILSLERKYSIVSLIALGYPAEKSAAEDYTGDVKYYKDEAGMLHVRNGR
jgi:nitroreductase